MFSALTNENPAATKILRAGETLRRALKPCVFSAPVQHVYQPLDYAWEAYANYVQRLAPRQARAVFMGMNPGPWGMAQTGVPFGEIQAVRDWLGIRGDIRSPAALHPKKPVLGWACRRREVSGQRLWGFIARRYGQPERWAARYYLTNYCPLLFLDAGGANLTPDKLPATEREPLLEACDAHLRDVLRALRPAYVVGIGKWAEKQAQRVVEGLDWPLEVLPLLHPSPANPKANAGWDAEAARLMDRLDALP